VLFTQGVWDGGVYVSLHLPDEIFATPRRCLDQGGRLGADVEIGVAGPASFNMKGALLSRGVERFNEGGFIGAGVGRRIIAARQSYLVMRTARKADILIPSLRRDKGVSPFCRRCPGW